MNKGFFKQDYFRYYGTKIHLDFVKHYFTNHNLRFLFFLRASQNIRFPVVRQLAQFMHFLSSNKYGLEIPASSRIGKGLYLGHAYGITINPGAVLGDNINLHKGVTIGRENRGKRQGVPSIGNQVWIGVKIGRAHV